MQRQTCGASQLGEGGKQSWQRRRRVPGAVGVVVSGVCCYASCACTRVRSRNVDGSIDPIGRVPGLRVQTSRQQEKLAPAQGLPCSRGFASTCPVCESHICNMRAPFLLAFFTQLSLHPMPLGLHVQQSACMCNGMATVASLHCRLHCQPRVQPAQAPPHHG